ncbi:MAG: hypothetical protein JXR14_11125 [Paracoccaceae bacterium]
MTGVLFDPLLPVAVLSVAVVLIVLMLGLSIWRGLSGWWLRAGAALVLLIALANPSLQDEEREPLSDIVVMVVDESASQNLSDRSAQAAEAALELEREIEARGMDLRKVVVPDGIGDAGTELMTALSETLAEEPRARIAGTVLITDGQLHDLPRAPDLNAPLHVLLTGREGDWDRRLIVRNAPAFAILGEEITLTVRVEDQGDVPADIAPEAELSISIDGEDPSVFRVPVGEDLDLPLTLPHGGMNVLQFQLAAAQTELTDRNNAAVVQINGVRDRLRVLLVSGEPHAGERTWRNLLKSDSAVDLVHFTILRPPEKQDGVPVAELSLIAFPTRELFLEKIDEFDLIIFDRYKRRGILPALYFDSIGAYAQQGGAVLVAAGPDFASADSISRSPLGKVLPATPTARVMEQGFKPRISELGARHPVTEGLEAFSPLPSGEDGTPGWGRWMRQIDLQADTGQTVMTGIDEKPLLILDRVGEGRVALLASDHAWLWHRGFEGGGPQLELLRRLAHWMMKEPDLEEEALTATAVGQTMTLTRRTLETEIGPVDITAPDGTQESITLDEVSPGRFVATYEGAAPGLYRIAEGTRETVIALGPSAPREFVETIATGAKLAPMVEATRGGVLALENGVPGLRMVSEGRNAAGRGWIGLTPRNAYLTVNVVVTPLVSPWLFFLMAALLSVAAWMREGQR